MRASLRPMEPPVPIQHAAPEGLTRRLRPPTPRAALTLIAFALLAVVLLAASGAVKPFVLGGVLVYLLAPVVERLARLGIWRPLAVLLTFVVAFGLVGIVAWVALTPLIQQLRLFITDLPDILANLRVGVEEFYAGLNLAPEIRALVDRVLADLAGGLGEIDIGAIVAPLVDSIVGVVSTITAYAILPAWLFFLLKDRLRLATSLERSLPGSWRGDVFAVFAISNRVFGNWIRGQVILGIVVGIASYIGLLVLGELIDPIFSRYAVLLAIIAGVLELVPFIGPIIAAVPAILLGFAAGPQGVAAAFFLYLGIQQLENNLLVPKIQGDAVELHPSAVLLALVVGASLGGVLGAIVSLPIASAARDIFRYLFHRVSDPPASVDGALAAISPSLTAHVRRSAVEASVPRTGPPVPGDPSGRADRPVLPVAPGEAASPGTAGAVITGTAGTRLEDTALTTTRAADGPAGS
jgi:predicted PurR-regulated permease PerM